MTKKCTACLTGAGREAGVQCHQCTPSPDVMTWGEEGGRLSPELLGGTCSTGQAQSLGS